ncbi:uncharacterized protein MONBRDRAFT_18443 [Monosiga brevicollis MX1]|uniref:Selenoprotein F n=1 Tax=Monosiga brevicollis TaxID=81824 RepID=A9UVP1_MONBE|nr:uncharacterized protein MONBRDRAFT_18443 [Monosiga brevicollis MX1]EDQ90618.1 predicted protein [Monosiga brevicollis MX1]|eukprot:XP_001744669.1 hypothetical protein [Monosiga brevicollis MX1]
MAVTLGASGLVVLVLLASVWGVQSGANGASSANRWSVVQCSEAGFTEGLVCSSCQLLPKFELEVLSEACSACCQDDGMTQGQVTKYPRAILEMCNCKLRAFPQIAPFVDGERKSMFKNLKHVHKHLAPPRLQLFNADGEMAEELNIESWDTDTITEFLEDRLEA